MVPVDERTAGDAVRSDAESAARAAPHVFTNYFCRRAQTGIDFPRVTARAAAA